MNDITQWTKAAFRFNKSDIIFSCLRSAEIVSCSSNRCFKIAVNWDGSEKWLELFIGAFEIRSLTSRITWEEAQRRFWSDAAAGRYALDATGGSYLPTYVSSDASTFLDVAGYITWYWSWIYYWPCSLSLCSSGVGTGFRNAPSALPVLRQQKRIWSIRANSLLIDRLQDPVLRTIHYQGLLHWSSGFQSGLYPSSKKISFIIFS